jgi:hypothetical protein
MRRLLAIAALALAPIAQADTYALLVGVNAVPQLPKRLHLHGAANDAALLRDTLLARGVPAAHITLLARGVPRSQGAPTLAALQQALADLRERVQPGDAVVLLLAGHGAQVPQTEGGQEADGFDEVFLAEDAARWDGRQLPGALKDKEVAAWMDAVVDRGARVFAVFDSCHAGGLLRGAAVQGQRAVLASELGLPQTPRLAQLAPRAPRLDGRVIALAARSHEVTGEAWLPRGAALHAARRHGFFSYAVAEALRQGAHSAEQLRGAVAAHYAAAGRSSPTPQILGDGALP